MWSLFTSKYVFALALLVVLVIALCVLFGRGCSCRDRQHRERIQTLGPFQVVSVDTGSTLTVERGRRGRRQALVTLAGIQAPAGEPWSVRARERLAAIAGDQVSVQVHRTHLFRGRETLAGEVFGADGRQLQLDLLAAGLATCAAEASDAYKAAEAEARKAKRGQWAPEKRRVRYAEDGEIAIDDDPENQESD